MKCLSPATWHMNEVIMRLSDLVRAANATVVNLAVACELIFG